MKTFLFILLTTMYFGSIVFSQTQKGIDIDGEAMGDLSGRSVSMPDANTVAIGAIFNDGNGSNAGHVRIYTWNGSAWLQKGTDLDGEAASDQSGYSVSMPDANTVAIGAILNDENGSNAGHVRIYTWNGSAWTQKGLDIDGETAGDQSGYSVSMPDANTVAIGARANDGNGTSSGHVRVYTWNGTSWTQKGVDIDGEAASDQSGYSVSMPDANTVAIGASFNDGNGTDAGHVRIFTWDGSAWTQKGIDIDGEAAGDYSGGSVSMPDANTVAIGATGNAVNGFFSGHVRVYTWNGSAWTQKGLDIDGEAADDQSGYSVSMPDPNTVAIGALNNDGNGSDAGHVRIYTWNGSAWTQKGLDIEGEEAGDRSGGSVSMPDANTVAIGAPDNDENGTSSGHVRVYCIPSEGTDVQTACDSYTWIDGNTYTASNNTATFTLTNAAGCDSIVTLDLTINSNTGTDVQTACDSYTWIDGNTYTASNNTATWTLTNIAGCDSIVTLDLTINNSNTGTDVQTACDSYTWIDGNTYTASNNTATWTLTNIAGCDSIVTLDLTINNSNTGTDVQTACDSYTWIDGNTYTASNNTATFTLTNAAGCDSIVTLDLTINNSTTATDVVTSCENYYTWINGVTYIANNNTATYSVPNAVGCDSIITLDLTFLTAVTGTDVQTACGTYTWIDGNTYAASTNTPTYTIVGGGANGCDSIVTLNLTILSESFGTDAITACDSYTWIDGNTYAASTNTPTYTIVGGGVNGCDSIVTLDLTINNSTTGTDVISACDTYTWIDGNTYAASNNTATWTLTNAAGCDSIVTLDLTINNSNAGTDVITACDSYTWIDGNTYTSSNNTATFTLTNVAGCDSIVTLNLTINPFPDNNVNQTGELLEADQVGATYQWLDCDDNYSIINAATGQSYTPEVTGNFAVEITLNGCADTSSCYLVDFTGISELETQIISIHPNPTSNTLFISGLDKVSEVQRMEVLSVTGKVVTKLEGINEQIDVSRLPNGVYFLTIQHKTRVESIRFVKQ